jgi:hypothetical protein
VVEIGSSFRIAGAVTPARPGKPVTVQQLAGSVWQTSQRVSLNSRSQYAATLRLTHTGVYRFRAVKPAERGYAASVSRTIAVRVVDKVRPLTNYAVASDDQGRNYEVKQTPDTTANSNGGSFPHSQVYAFTARDEGRTGSSYAEYTIDRAWGSMRATLGVTDDSPTGADGYVEIFGDAHSLGRWKVELGKTIPIQVPLTGVAKLRFHVSADLSPNLMVGHPLLSTAHVASAVAPSAPTTFLADLTPVSMEGTNAALYTAASEYDLSRASNQLTFVSGLEDRFASGTASIRILGDGKELYTGRATSGSGTPVTIDVTSVLRLRIEVTLDQADSVLVLGDARLLK